MLCTVGCCWRACGGDRFSALVSITKPCKVMKHKQPYVPGSYMSSVFVRIYKRFLPRPSASIAVFLLLALVFQPLAVVLAYEESGQTQVSDTSSFASASLDSRAESAVTEIAQVDVVEASPSIILDNIAGVREEALGNSLTEADVVLDPVTDAGTPEATGTETADGGNKDDIANIEAPALGAPGAEPQPVRDIYKESTQKLGDVDMKTGAFTYTYDFNLPAARGDVQPIFALNYNSQNQNYVNLAGYGWEYSTPYIKRLNKHGSNALYENNDYYSSMSGELVAVSIDASGYGEYRAEVEDGSFVKYIRNADDSWTMMTKEGIVYNFGTTAASRQDDPADASHVFKWMLAINTDTNNNMDYLHVL